MAKNYLLIYSEQLATDIELLCQNIKAPSTLFFKFAKVQAVYTPISVKQTTDRAKRICFQNLKLRSKNVVKRKAGYSYCLIQRALMKKRTKTNAICAVESDVCLFQVVKL